MAQDTLRPAERLAFVLHDAFDVPFGEICGVIDRSPAAARQLASRARLRDLDIVFLNRNDQRTPPS
jgi:DNA-directed RNA polymerase specialized sigma24 family protein